MAIDDRVISSSELSLTLIDELLAAGESFQVVAVANLGAVVNEIEGRIERAGLSCRIYTEYRAVATTGSLFTPAALLGAVAGIAITAHNLVTLNPDYEIGKNKVKGMITVICKDKAKVLRHFETQTTPSSKPNWGFEAAISGIGKRWMSQGK